MGRRLSFIQRCWEELLRTERRRKRRQRHQEEAVPSVTWIPSPGTTNPHIEISTDGVVVTSLDDTGGAPAILPALTGKVVVRMIPTFAGSVADSETSLGVATSTDPTSIEAGEDGVYGVPSTGNTGNLNGVSPRFSNIVPASPFASGENVDIFYNGPAGKGWIITENGPNGDPEEETGANFEFALDTPLYGWAWIWSTDNAASVSVAVVPSHSSGTYNSLESLA